MKTHKISLAVLLLVGLILGILGCAGVGEGLRGIAGVSTRELEKARPEAIVRNFDCDLATCVRLAEETLSRIKTHTYAKRQDLIAVYVSQTDTTPVGVFFKAVEPNKTEVAVSSQSTYAKELIASSLFAGIDKALHPEAEVK